MRTIIKSIVDTIIYILSFFVSKERHSVKRVLIFRKDGLGDYILFFPFLKDYRDYFKDSEITIVAPIIFRSLGSLLSDFHKVIWFDNKEFSKNVIYRAKFIFHLKRAGFDVTIYPAYSREPIVDRIMKIIGAPIRIGINGDFDLFSSSEAKSENNKIYTRLIELKDAPTLELERDQLIAEQICERKIEIRFPTIDPAILNKKDLSEKYALVFPGVRGVSYRMWPLSNFAKVSDHLLEKGITPVFAGSTREKEITDGIISLMKKSGAMNIAGQTEEDFVGLASYIHKSLFYVGSDTGVLHLAVAIGTPTIAVVGSGGRDRFFPYGDLEKNRAVIDRSREYKTGSWKDVANLKPGEIHPSILNVQAEDVMAEIDRMIDYLNRHA